MSYTHPPVFPALKMWTVYDHPTDHPDYYVARLFQIERGVVKPTPTIMRHGNLHALRREFEDAGLAKVIRSPGDDLCILESWL